MYSEKKIILSRYHNLVKMKMNKKISFFSETPRLIICSLIIHTIVEIKLRRSQQNTQQRQPIPLVLISRRGTTPETQKMSQKLTIFSKIEIAFHFYCIKLINF